MLLLYGWSILLEILFRLSHCLSVTGVCQEVLSLHTIYLLLIFLLIIILFWGKKLSFTVITSQTCQNVKRTALRKRLIRMKFYQILDKTPKFAYELNYIRKVRQFAFKLVQNYKGSKFKFSYKKDPTLCKFVLTIGHFLQILRNHDRWKNNELHILKSSIYYIIWLNIKVLNIII